MEGYDVYGLKLNSEIPLKNWPALKPFEPANSTLKWGKVTKPIDDQPDTIYLPFSSYNEDYYYQEVPTIAKYMVDKNADITIELLDTTKNKRNIALIIFWDTIIPIALLKNNIFALRASAVQTKNQKISLFTGPRGVGKSTLAAALCLSGHKLICDDICVLKWDEESQKLMSKSYTGHLDLWQDTFSLLENRQRKFDGAIIRKEIKKFRIDFASYQCDGYWPVESIYLMKPVNEETEFEIKRLKGIQKITASKKLIHSNHIAQKLNKQTLLFKFNELIAKNLDLYILEKSNLTTVTQTSNYLNSEIFTGSNL